MFQRLRWIRQNGIMNVVFHGAEHSRFSHAMGVAHVAGMMFDAIVANTPDACPRPGFERDREDTILAGLLHDIGHGPFSHTLEEILGKEKFDHERMTVRILSEESEIHQLLKGTDDELPDRLIPFIDKKRRTSPTWYHSIVSSQLDADRLDYLMRDATMAGVWSHRFDLQRLIRSLGVHENEIVVDERASDIIESYLLALDQMYRIAYYHKTNRAATFLLRAIINRVSDCLREAPGEVSRFFPQPSSAPFLALLQQGHEIPLDLYQRIDESDVWSLIGSWRDAGDPVLDELVPWLRSRHLPKVIVAPDVPLKTLQGIEEDLVQQFMEEFPEKDPRYYITVDLPKRKSYTAGTYEEGFANSIKVLGLDNKLVAIEKRERSIAKLIESIQYYPALIVPPEFRDAARAQLKGTPAVPRTQWTTGRPSKDTIREKRGRHE